MFKHIKKVLARAHASPALATLILYGAMCHDAYWAFWLVLVSMKPFIFFDICDINASSNLRNVLFFSVVLTALNHPCNSYVIVSIVCVVKM